MGIPGIPPEAVYPCIRLQSNPTQNCWIRKNGFKQTNLRFGALVSGKFNLSEYVDDTPIIDGNEPDLLRILAKPLFGRFIDAAECSKIYSLRNLTR